MDPFYSDSHIRFYNKDCRYMGELGDGSVQCVVTSPPFWGLRKYAGEQDLVWGDGHCEHEWVAYKRPAGGGHPTGAARVGATKADIQRIYDGSGSWCSHCGAWKGAYGLEPTPEMYIEHTITILREVRRVLREDGVVFWDIGDSYYGGGRGADYKYSHATYEAMAAAKPQWQSEILKPKDLCLIPFRVAIAAQEDGWWVRSVIIWSKPNAMPESVTDRPTDSHEYILMLTKAKNYYWDAEAVREPYSPTKRWGGDIYKGAIKVAQYIGRNLRSVWEFPTQPYPGVHFAVFPEELPESCIKAATPGVGCCSKCGAPWERILEKSPMVIRRSDRRNRMGMGYANGTPASGTMLKPPEVKTIGWQPTCKCNAGKVPSIVLDPFMGTGTTLWVAKNLGRRAVGYDLSGEYCALAVKRNQQQVMWVDSHD